MLSGMRKKTEADIDIVLKNEQVISGKFFVSLLLNIISVVSFVISICIRPI